MKNNISTPIIAYALLHRVDFQRLDFYQYKNQTLSYSLENQSSLNVFILFCIFFQKFYFNMAVEIQH